MMPDELTLKIAAFVIQALDLADDPTTLASEVIALKRDLNAGISSVELDSSIGPAAFLIYHYLLNDVNGDGQTGQAIFEADLATLERAAQQETPGPRILVHATGGDEAYILATTPTTFHALTGTAPGNTLEATAADLLPGAESAAIRTSSADELLRLLREANDQASDWLRAIQSEGRVATADDSDQLTFNDAESALALFLLDDRSIGNLLRLLNLMISSARQQASNAVRGE